MMGLSYESDTTRKCYNMGASWELGWYGRRRKSINFSREPAYRGRLIGIVDYENPGARGMFVMVRAQSSTTANEVYIGFNSVRGFNIDSFEAKEQVTVTMQEDEGLSTRMAGIGAGGSYRLPNFQGSKGLNIKVYSINRSANPPYADVEMSIDGCPAGSTSSGCYACASNADCVRGHACVTGTCNAGACSFDTSMCPGNFQLSLRTDDWGSETSWQLINTCSGDVVLQGGSYSNNAQVSVSQVIGQNPHKLVLLDSGEDGFGASGQLTATLDGLEVARETGNFKYDEIFYFGSENCGPRPTRAPTPAPVTVPTPAPVIVPTPEPVLVPTPEPVVVPTPAPVPGWNQIFYEGFESGTSSIFNTGSLARVSRTRSFRGRFSVEIRDNEAGSAITTIPINVSGYRQLQINFQYYTVGADAGERFFLEYSFDGVSNFQTIRTFTMGSDFVNMRWTSVSQIWDIPGTSMGSVRIRSEFSIAGERISIDEITLRGLG